MLPQFLGYGCAVTFPSPCTFIAGTSSQHPCRPHHCLRLQPLPPSVPDTSGHRDHPSPTPPAAIRPRQLRPPPPQSSVPCAFGRRRHGHPSPTRPATTTAIHPRLLRPPSVPDASGRCRCHPSPTTRPTARIWLAPPSLGVLILIPTSLINFAYAPASELHWRMCCLI